MIFINNKYTKIYYSIINSANARDLPKNIYSEQHHIIPRSIGGNNSKDNLVTLTAREHFVCHLLLTKMTFGENKIKMSLAAYMLVSATSKNQNRYKVTNRVYNQLKINFSEAKKGKATWNKGKKVTDINILANIKNAAALREENYKSGKLSRGNMGKYKRTEEHINKLREGIKANSKFSTKGQSIEARKRAAINISKARKGQPANNKGISPSQVSCVCCRKIVDVRNFSRFHGINCKLANSALT